MSPWIQVLAYCVLFDGKVHQKRQLPSQKNAFLSMVVYGWLKRLMRSATDRIRQKKGPTNRLLLESSFDLLKTVLDSFFKVTFTYL